MTTRGPLNFLVIPKQHNRLSIHLFSIRTSPALRVAGVAGASQVSLVRKLGLAVGEWAVYRRTNKHSHSHSHLQAIYSLQFASRASLWTVGGEEPTGRRCQTPHREALGVEPTHFLVCNHSANYCTSSVSKKQSH